MNSDCFDKVIVSTDDPEIAEVGQAYGAAIPFMRPVELANDYAGTLPVIKHAIEWFEQNQTRPNNVCCIYATAPFVQAETIKAAYQQLQDIDADYCFTVTSFPFPIQRAVKITENQRLQMFYPDKFNTRSQDLEKAYHDAGQFYWGRAEAFKAQKQLFSEAASPYVLPGYLVQDIDTLEDWTRAEMMYQVIKRSGII